MYKIFIISSSVLLVCSVRADHDSTVTRYNSHLDTDGSYAYDVAQSNGAEVKESGVGGKYATGSYKYYSPEGELVQVTYTADEHGYHPQSDSLPTSPPIPAYILKSLEYNREHPEQEEEEHNQLQQHVQLHQHQEYDQLQQHEQVQQHVQSLQYQQHDQLQQHVQLQQHDQGEQYQQYQQHDQPQQYDHLQQYQQHQHYQKFQQHDQPQ